MSPRARVIAVLAGSLLGSLAAGCSSEVHVAHVRSGPALAPKPSRTPIPMFFNERPARPYREIGQIRVRTSGSSATLDEVLSAAAEDARQLGADAVIIDLRAHYGSLPVTVDCNGRPNVPAAKHLNARAIAIIFAPGDRSEPTPTGPAPRPGCMR